MQRNGEDFTFLASIPSVGFVCAVVPPPFILLVPYLHSIYKSIYNLPATKKLKKGCELKETSVNVNINVSLLKNRCKTEVHMYVI